VRKEQDLLRSFALEARVDDFPDAQGRVLHAVRPLARIHELDLAAQRAQPPGDQLGGAIQALEVAAAGLDRDELLQRVEERLALLLCEREHRLHRLRGGLLRRNSEQRGRENRGNANSKTANWAAHGSSSCSCGAIASRAVYRYALTCISPRTMWRGA
jgi:hypothetical protein